MCKIKCSIGCSSLKIPYSMFALQEQREQQQKRKQQLKRLVVDLMLTKKSRLRRSTTAEKIKYNMPPFIKVLALLTTKRKDTVNEAKALQRDALTENLM